MPLSSMAEQRAVNSKVVGSSPAGAANGCLTPPTYERVVKLDMRVLHNGSAPSFQVGSASSILVTRSMWVNHTFVGDTLR
jgi:hypothetical protein